MAANRRNSGAKKTAAEISSSIPEVTLGKHPVTSSMRPYPTKERAMMVSKRDTLAYEEYVRLFTCQTVESRNRPAVGWSTFGGMVAACSENLNRAKALKLTGAGLESLIAEFAEHKASGELISTFGTSTQVRDTESIKEATGELLKWLKSLNSKDQFPLLVTELRRLGSTFLQVSHHLAEWASAEADLFQYGEDVGRPADQPQPEAFLAFKQETASKKRKRAAFEEYMGAALSNRSVRSASSTAPPAEGDLDFENM